MFWFFFRSPYFTIFWLTFHFTTFTFKLYLRIFEKIREKIWKSQKKTFFLFLSEINFLSILDGGVVRFHPYHLYFCYFTLSIISLNCKYEITKSEINPEKTNCVYFLCYAMLSNYSTQGCWIGTAGWLPRRTKVIVFITWNTTKIEVLRVESDHPTI